MKRLLVTSVLGILALVALAAEPYEKMMFGLMGTVSTAMALRMEEGSAVKDLSFGAQLHATALVSIRPSIILRSNTRRIEDIYNDEPEYKQKKDLYIGGQIDIPLHFLRFPDGSIYAGPSVMLMSASLKEYSLYLNAPYKSKESESTAIAIGATLGGQYQPSRRFGVFLDLGLDFLSKVTEVRNYDNMEMTTSEDKTTTNQVFFRGATIGVVLYMN